MWGFPQPLLFNEIKHINFLEVVSHRSVWSFFFLFFAILALGKIKEFYQIFNNINLLFWLTITGFLISCNWLGFILAINFQRLQDASLGYYMTPLISIALGYFFLKEDLNFQKTLSLFLMLFSIIILILNYGKIPFLAIFIGLTWSVYGLIRKKLPVNAEIGLLFESGIISLIAFPYLFLKFVNGEGVFIYSNSYDSFILIITGLFTILPLFFFNIGVKFLPLGLTGVIFFLVPTFHFITSILILNEEITNIKLITFSIIWIAVIIFVRDKFKENYRE